MLGSITEFIAAQVLQGVNWSLNGFLYEHGTINLSHQYGQLTYGPLRFNEHSRDLYKLIKPIHGRNAST